MIDQVLQLCRLKEATNVQVIDGSGRLSTEYGVNTRSMILALQHFDICSGTLLPDVPLRGRRATPSPAPGILLH